MKLYMHKSLTPEGRVCWRVVGYEPMAVCQMGRPWRVGIFDVKAPQAGFRFVPNPLTADVLPAADPDYGELWLWLIKHRIALKEFETRKDSLREIGRVLKIEPLVINKAEKE